MLNKALESYDVCTTDGIKTRHKKTQLVVGSYNSSQKHLPKQNVKYLK